MNIYINEKAIQKLTMEWKNQKTPWMVQDTPLFHADAFADNIFYIFMGCVIHYRFYGILDNGASGCYYTQNAEGSIAYWRAVKQNWRILNDHKLKFDDFARIFQGLAFLEERYEDWISTIRIVKLQYSGQIKNFLESCNWDVQEIVSRMTSEFPAFLSKHDNYPERIFLFLYLAQGKYATANLFNKVELIQPYFDQIMLAALLQANVLESNSTEAFSSEDIPQLRSKGFEALNQLLQEWSITANRSILPAEINKPLRSYGQTSVWRNKVPLLFA